MRLRMGMGMFLRLRLLEVFILKRKERNGIPCQGTVMSTEIKNEQTGGHHPHVSQLARHVVSHVSLPLALNDPCDSRIFAIPSNQNKITKNHKTKKKRHNIKFLMTLSIITYREKQ